MSQYPAKAIALFSGGLDSILAAKLIQEQGLEVACLHFVSPFFGKARKIDYWREQYGLDIRPLDISENFAQLMANRPKYGFGSVLNPCVDCKILMLTHARKVMEDTGACCIISGEVLGQRPMSQRRDTLNVIRRDAELKGKLLRPLCAQHLDPTEAELDGTIDRNRLLGITGRGRKEQMALAERFQIRDIPTPAVGCRLAEKENARSYWPVLRFSPSPSASDFHLANTGRQYWHIPQADGKNAFWLTVGRKQEDNSAIMQLAGPKDLLIKARDFPGPIGIARSFGTEWPAELVRAAAAFTASYSPKATRHAEEQNLPVAVRIHSGSLDEPGTLLEVFPSREPDIIWSEYSWQAAREEIKAEAKIRAEAS